MNLIKKIFKYIYKAWMGIAKVINFFMTRLILLILFYLVLTPMGVIARLLGKDMLDQKIDRTSKSYWHDRESEVKTKESYENQY